MLLIHITHLMLQKSKYVYGVVHELRYAILGEKNTMSIFSMPLPSHSGSIAEFLADRT